jgi:hypothetical protein
MAYEGEDSKHCARVEAARNKVAEATAAYRRGGSASAVDKANRELAEASYRWREWSGGLVEDKR